MELPNARDACENVVIEEDLDDQRVFVLFCWRYCSQQNVERLLYAEVYLILQRSQLYFRRLAHALHTQHRNNHWQYNRANHTIPTRVDIHSLRHDVSPAMPALPE